MSPKFFSVVAEFAVYPKTDDVTLDFFNFLQNNYPTVWERLNEFYADDCDGGTDFDWENPPKWELPLPNPRIARYGWDRLLESGAFGLFLNALKSIWLELTDQYWGVCESCKQETELEDEHSIIVSWGFGPMVKVYEHFEMDGSVFKEQLICRECIHKMLTSLMSKMDPEKVTCWT